MKTGVRGGARSGNIVGGTIVRKVEDGGAPDIWRTVFQKATEGPAKGCYFFPVRGETVNHRVPCGELHESRLFREDEGTYRAGATPITKSWD